MHHPFQKRNMQLLEKGLVAFLLLQTLSVVVIYILDPDLYLMKLSLEPSEAARYPWAMMLLVIAILVVLLVIIYGVIRHWRWLFWLLLLLCGGNALGLGVSAVRQFASDVPTHAPLWLNLYSLALPLILGGFTIWMMCVYFRSGVWGIGKKKED